MKMKRLCYLMLAASSLTLTGFSTQVIAGGDLPGTQGGIPL
ncbi:hypothetical protein [Shewanella algae]|nr:hypothetical protein [Shewanella algae]